VAANLRMLKADTTFTWDGASQAYPMGTLIDVPAGSALETAIGSGNLISIGPSSTPTALSIATGGVMVCDIQDIGS